MLGIFTTIFAVYEIFFYNNYSLITIPLLVVLFSKSYLNNLKLSFIKGIFIELFYFLWLHADLVEKEGLIKSIGYLFLSIFNKVEYILNYYYKTPLFHIIRNIFIFCIIFTILQSMDYNICSLAPDATFTIIIKYIAILFFFLLLFYNILNIFVLFFHNKEMETSNPMLYKVINFVFIFILFILFITLMHLICIIIGLIIGKVCTLLMNSLGRGGSGGSNSGGGGSNFGGSNPGPGGPGPRGPVVGEASSRNQDESRDNNDERSSHTGKLADYLSGYTGRKMRDVSFFNKYCNDNKLREKDCNKISNNPDLEDIHYYNIFQSVILDRNFEGLAKPYHYTKLSYVKVDSTLISKIRKLNKNYPPIDYLLGISNSEFAQGRKTMKLEKFPE